MCVGRRLCLPPVDSCPLPHAPSSPPTASTSSLSTSPRGYTHWTCASTGAPGRRSGCSGLSACPVHLRHGTARLRLASSTLPPTPCGSSARPRRGARTCGGTSTAASTCGPSQKRGRRSGLRGPPEPLAARSSMGGQVAFSNTSHTDRLALQFRSHTKMAVPGTAVPGTSAGGMGFMFGRAGGQAPEGQLTSMIYGLIRDQKYTEATRILTIQLQNFPRSRAALSLLGYCFYQQQDYRSSAQVRRSALGIERDAVCGHLAHSIRSRRTRSS